jgi:hypothetical protein
MPTIIFNRTPGTDNMGFSRPHLLGPSDFSDLNSASGDVYQLSLDMDVPTGDSFSPPRVTFDGGAILQAWGGEAGADPTIYATASFIDEDVGAFDAIGLLLAL